MYRVICDTNDDETTYEKMYEYMDEYNLQLRGFSDMQLEFISKSLEILNNMKSKNLLQFTDSPVTEETKSFDDTTGTDRSSVEPVHDPIEVSKEPTSELEDTPNVPSTTTPKPIYVRDNVPAFGAIDQRQPIATYGGKKSIRKNRRKNKKTRKHGSRKHRNKKTLKKQKKIRRNTYKH
jgi:hypothetical protein